ncbi:MAG: LysR family transcriptional regulator [Verrucomicrobiota bacterium]
MLNEIHDSRCEPEKLPVIDAGIMDSKRLQMFYVSVKEGSFAAAAQILTVSPSAVSHAMKALEEDLDCALFRRSGPQVTPTGAAMRLLPMVEDMLVRMAAIKHELAATHGRQESLVFRLPVGLTDLVRAGVLSTFHECFPAADLEMILREEGGAVGKLDFEIDHAHRVPREMVRRDLLVEEFHAHVAPFHELGQKSRVTPAELRRFLCILPDAFVSESLARQMEPGAAGRIKKWMVPDAAAASGLARNGQGIAFLTNLAAADAVADGSLVRLKLPGVVIRRTCCAWWSPQRPLTWVAEVFLSLLETRMLSAGDGG